MEELTKDEIELLMSACCVYEKKLVYDDKITSELRSKLYLIIVKLGRIFQELEKVKCRVKIEIEEE